MKNICVVSPEQSKESASWLAELLGARYKNIHNLTSFSTSKADLVINYGSSIPIFAGKIINHPQAVAICVNKISTLKRLCTNCNTVEWTKRKEEARLWINTGFVVSYEFETKSRSEGVIINTDLFSFENSPAKFWTKYFTHSHEVRINVFRDQILSIYEKISIGDLWDFIPLKILGANDDVTQMIRAIRENIGIDFYGMDVLVGNNGRCKLLEVNSGAILHDETEKPLVKMIKKEM